MSRILDSVYTRDASLGSHYEEKLRATLTKIWRHKLLVIATVAAALVIGIALALMMPKRYTAEGYVRGTFWAEDAFASAPKGGGSMVTLDGSLLVETGSRLLQSQQLARRVVERLGLERIRPAVSTGLLSSWLRSTFYGDTARAPGYQEDMAAKGLLRGLSVKTEPRVYQIELSYTAADPDLAALITNAFLVEFMQTTKLQILSHQLDSAQRALSANLATLGEKHPKAIEARTQLQAADARLKAELSKTTEEIERTSGGNITLARVDTVPSSPPNPLIIIGIALLVGLVGGASMAVFVRH